MKKMTENGISTTLIPGEENYETYYPCPACIHTDAGQISCVQYDYRDMDGELFATVRSTLDECRKERDLWVIRKKRSKR